VAVTGFVVTVKDTEVCPDGTVILAGMGTAGSLLNSVIVAPELGAPPSSPKLSVTGLPPFTEETERVRLARDAGSTVTVQFLVSPS